MIVRLTWLQFLTWFVAAPIALAAESATAAELTVVGYIEKATVGPGSLTMHAKLDTGAQTSSLSASGIHRFRQHGGSWVRFDVANRDGDSLILERRVVRIAKIKQHSGASQERVVVLLDLCVATVLRTVEVNLTDRSDFEYPLLVGRNFLSGHLLVDSARQYTREPRC